MYAYEIPLHINMILEMMTQKKEHEFRVKHEFEFSPLS